METCKQKNISMAYSNSDAFSSARCFDNENIVFVDWPKWRAFSCHAFRTNYLNNKEILFYNYLIAIPSFKLSLIAFFQKLHKK